MRPAGVDERRQAPRGRHAAVAVRVEQLRRRSRRARPGSGSRRAPRARRQLRLGHALERLEAHEALDERGQRGGVADRASARPSRAPRACRARLQAHVPPDERRLRDRAAADQHVDRLDVARVGRRTRAAGRCAGTPGRPACARRPARCRAAHERRVRRQREQHRDVRAHAVERAHRQLGVRDRDVHVQRERRLAPGQLAQRRVQVLVARAGRDLDVLRRARADACRRPRRAARARGPLAASARAQVAQLAIAAGATVACGSVASSSASPCVSPRAWLGELGVEPREHVLGAPRRRAVAGSSSMTSSSMPTVHGASATAGFHRAQSGSSAPSVMRRTLTGRRPRRTRRSVQVTPRVTDTRSNRSATRRARSAPAIVYGVATRTFDDDEALLHSAFADVVAAERGRRRRVALLERAVALGRAARDGDEAAADRARRARRRPRPRRGRDAGALADALVPARQPGRGQRARPAPARARRARRAARRGAGSLRDAIARPAPSAARRAERAARAARRRRAAARDDRPSDRGAAPHDDRQARARVRRSCASSTSARRPRTPTTRGGGCAPPSRSCGAPTSCAPSR